MTELYWPSIRRIGGDPNLGGFARRRPGSTPPQASAGQTNKISNNRRNCHDHYDEGPDLASGALIIFIDENGGGPGARLRKSSQ